MRVGTTTRALNARPDLRRYDDVRELIATPANPTPLVKLTRVAPHDGFALYLKARMVQPVWVDKRQGSALHAARYGRTWRA